MLRFVHIKSTFSDKSWWDNQSCKRISQRKSILWLIPADSLVWCVPGVQMMYVKLETPNGFTTFAHDTQHPLTSTRARTRRFTYKGGYNFFTLDIVTINLTAILDVDFLVTMHRLGFPVLLSSPFYMYHPTPATQWCRNSWSLESEQGMRLLSHLFYNEKIHYFI